MADNTEHGDIDYKLNVDEYPESFWETLRDQQIEKVKEKIDFNARQDVKREKQAAKAEKEEEKKAAKEAKTAKTAKTTKTAKRKQTPEPEADITEDEGTDDEMPDESARQIEAKRNIADCVKKINSNVTKLKRLNLSKEQKKLVMKIVEYTENIEHFTE